MNTWKRLITLLLLAVWIIACSPRFGDTKGVEPDKGRIQMDSKTLLFESNRLADLPATQLVNIQYDADALSLEMPEFGLPDWVSISTSEQPVKRLTQLNISINRSDLDAGTYHTKLRLIATLHNPKTSEIKSTYKDLAIEYKINDDLAPHVDELVFTNTKGSGESPVAQTLRIFGSKSKWSATAAHSWVKLDKNSGEGLDKLEVRIDEEKTQKPGLYQSEIILLDLNKKKTKTVKVEYQLEPQRLVVSEKGIAFTHTRLHKKLSQRILVTSNSKGSIEWQASVDVPWLKLVKATGKTGDVLEVKALPNRLTEGLYPATIRVSPVNDPWVKHAREIAVGLYVNNIKSQDNISIAAPSGPDDRDMIADPVRPLVYISHGEDSIHVYNIYTGEVEESIEDVGEKIRALAIDQKGNRLFAADAKNFTIAVIDLDSREVDEIWPGPYFRAAKNGMDQHVSLVYSLTDGRPVLITNSLTLVDPENGQILKRFHASTNGNQPCCLDGPPHITVSRDGKTLFVYERHSQSHEIYRLKLEYSYLPGGGFKVNQTGYMVEEGMATDIAVSPDGLEVCTASDGQSEIKCYFGETVAPSRNLTAENQSAINNIEFDPDGNIYGGFVTENPHTADIWSFDSDSGNHRKTYSVEQKLNPRQMILSSDGKRIISRSNNYGTISFINL